MAEYLVFARGMGNFSRSRATEAEQEDLLRVGLADKHELVGAFDDSGNYAFRTRESRHSLQQDVLRTIGARYEIKEVIE